MRSFKDGAGRAWNVEITVLSIKQVAARTGFQIARLLDDNMAGFAALVSDPVKFVDVLFVLVGEQATKVPVTEEQFFRGLSGDALEAAYDAFRGAFEDFSPSHLRQILRAVSEKAKVAQQKATDAVLKRIADLGADPISSTSVTATPASPESIPAG